MGGDQAPPWLRLGLSPLLLPSPARKGPPQQRGCCTGWSRGAEPGQDLGTGRGAGSARRAPRHSWALSPRPSRPAWPARPPDFAARPARAGPEPHRGTGRNFPPALPGAGPDPGPRGAAPALRQRLRGGKLRCGAGRAPPARPVVTHSAESPKPPPATSSPDADSHPLKLAAGAAARAPRRRTRGGRCDLRPGLAGRGARSQPSPGPARRPPAAAPARSPRAPDRSALPSAPQLLDGAVAGVSGGTARAGQGRAEAEEPGVGAQVCGRMRGAGPVPPTWPAGCRGGYAEAARSPGSPALV